MQPHSWSPQHDGVPARTSAHSRRRDFLRAWPPVTVSVLVASVGCALVLLLALFAFLTYYGYYQLEGRILPGVQVGEAQLGGKTIQEAAIELHKTWNLARRILVDDGLHAWTLAPEEIGLSVAAVETAQEAYKVGHGQSFLAEIDQLVYSQRNGWPVAPLVRLDVEAARAKLQALDALARKPARDASLAWDGSKFVAVPAELGYALDIEAALAELAADPRAVLLRGYLHLELKPLLPAVTDVSGVLAEAESILNTPADISAYDPVNDETISLVIPRERLGSWLRIDAALEGATVRVDEHLVAGYLEGLEAVLGSGRWIDASRYSADLAQAIQQGAALQMIVRHRPESYLVKPGDTLLSIGWKVGMPFWRILAANPGIDPDNLWAGTELVIPSKDELLPYPVVPGKRIVISISKQRLWIYQDGKLLSKHVISTGMDRSPTQPGVFQVQTHELEAYASVWDLYMPHFIGIYEAWPGFMNGIHGLPTLANGRRLWANILGKPASYGCIIMDLKAAKWLYGWAEQGVVVEIRP